MATIYEYILKLNAQMNGVDVANRALKKTDELANKANSSVTGLGGKLKTAFSSIPGADFVTNPIVAAGAALVASGRMAMKFDESMAKVNTTAQLAPEKLKKLKNELMDMGTKAGANLSEIPDAYEKILSQTGDVSLSTDILRASLQGAKAGFTDQGVVAAALAQTLSLVGKENTNAQEVLDTMFAAKRVGAGEFKDFANYIPGLIASGKALGIGFKDTAGLFAFMTGKGQSAERSATLMENAFTALGKSEITKGLESAGVDIFNTDGSMKKMDVIFGQLQKKLATFGTNDKAKSNFLESIGLKDAQAKQAFMILASDGAKLTEVLGDVANAQGETATAFGLSTNPMQNMSLLWSKIQKLGIGFGGVISAVLVPAISGLLFILTPVVDTLSWLFTELTDGNPVVWAIVAAIGAYVVIANSAAIVTGIVSGATAVWTGAQWLLNAALNANPIGLLIAGIALLIGVIIYAYQKVGWFRGIIYGSWEALKGFGNIIKDYVIDRFKGLLSGLGGIGKALVQFFKGDYKAAWETAKQAGADLLGVDAAKNAVNSAKAVGKNIGAAYHKGVAEVDAKNKAGLKNEEQSGIAAAVVPGVSPDGGGGTPAIKPDTEKVASGGTRNTSITINLGKMVESIVFQGGVKENENDLVSQVEAAMLRVLYAAESAS